MGPAMRTEVLNDFDLGGTESPESIGHTVVALPRDFDLLAKTERMLTVGDLASGYGFTHRRTPDPGLQVSRPTFFIPGLSYGQVPTRRVTARASSRVGRRGPIPPATHPLESRRPLPLGLTPDETVFLP